MTINGTFDHNNGLVSFAGTNQLISAVATTTFYDLSQIATTSATTTFSTSSPFVVLRNLILQGATSSQPLRLRSVASGTQWSIDAQSSNSPTLRFLDVQDSNNISATTTVLFCNRSCIDSGNNTNWDFSSTTPLVALSNHPLGQVNNAFSGSSLSDEPLFAFNLTPAFETATTTVSLTISNTIGVTSSSLTDWRLYRDANANQIVDGGDIQVGGAGTFATTSVVFGTAFLVSTSSAYIVTADGSGINQGDRITISLETGSVVATSTQTSETLPVVGSVSSTNHLRSKKGGGGGSVNFVNIGAPGNGIVGGGTNEGGQELGGEPNFNPPTTTGSPHNQWTNGASGYLSDGAYASETTAGERQSYATYGFNIPSNNQITGIEVKLEASATTPAGTIEVALSWDNGTSITTVQSTATLSSTDTIYTLGSPSDLWGRAWVPSEFSNGTFGLRIIGQPSGGNTVQVDAIQVRVYHQATGGGAGGGGGEL
jgi:hypothetical protein